MERLTQKRINGIKFFMKERVELMKNKGYAEFRLREIKIFSNGDYYFQVQWAWHMEDNFYCQGNLFKIMPKEAINDELDAAIILIAPIKNLAFKYLIEHAHNELKIIQNDYNFLKDKIYATDRESYNSEKKEIKPLEKIDLHNLLIDNKIFTNGEPELEHNNDKKFFIDYEGKTMKNILDEKGMGDCWSWGNLDSHECIEAPDMNWLFNVVWELYEIQGFKKEEIVKLLEEYFIERKKTCIKEWRQLAARWMDLFPEEYEKMMEK